MKHCFPAILMVLITAGCGPSYKAKPLPFKAPSAYANHCVLAGSELAAKAYINEKEAADVFGFDIIKAGMLPVQVVFDNNSGHALEVVASQTFLEDKEGNLWPVLSDRTAYDRATKYAETKAIFKEGAEKGGLGAVAGALVGAAIGIVSGDSIAASVGKGAAVGAAAGATMGGASKLDDKSAAQAIMRDFESKSLQNKSIPGHGLAYGVIFFPAEARGAQSLRLQVKQVNTGQVFTARLSL